MATGSAASAARTTSSASNWSSTAGRPRSHRRAARVVLPSDAPCDRADATGCERAARHQLRVSGARTDEAGRDARPGERRCRAHDLALPPTFKRLELRPNVRQLAADVIRNVGQILWILLAAVLVVLLIACGNVANLFLVRAEGRHQELACVPHSGPAAAGSRARCSRRAWCWRSRAACSVWLAQAAIALLRTIAPAELPRVDDIGIDWMVLLFTVSVSVLSGTALRRPCRHPIREAEHHGAQGGRSIGQRRSWPPPHARCAGHGTNRIGAHAVDRVGVDDSNVYRDASGRPRFPCAPRKCRRSFSRYRQA